MPYAPVNDLSLYYEVHGEGPPLILLHGSYMTADMMAPLATGLAATRQVIVPEMQGHGRTADADRPITYEQMADDVAALADAMRLEDELYRTCVPGPDPKRWLCLFVNTRQRPAGVALDADRAPNAVYRGAGGFR